MINETDGVIFYKEYIPAEKESEKNLIKLIQQGDKEARNRLVLKHIKFAIFAAKKRIKRNFEIEDLIQDSIEGMLMAADRVNTDYHNNFTTYANWYIIAQLSKTFEFHESGIKIPREKNKIAVDYALKKECSIRNNEAFLTDAKLDMYNSIKERVSEEEFLKTEDYVNISTIKSDLFLENIERESFYNDLRGILKSLPFIESKVITFHYGLFGEKPKTHREIGKYFGKSSSWSQQLEKKILLKIKQQYPYLKDYLIGA